MSVNSGNYFCWLPCAFVCDDIVDVASRLSNDITFFMLLLEVSKAECTITFP